MSPLDVVGGVGGTASGGRNHQRPPTEGPDCGGITTFCAASTMQVACAGVPFHSKERATTLPSALATTSTMPTAGVSLSTVLHTSATDRLEPRSLIRALTTSTPG